MARCYRVVPFLFTLALLLVGSSGRVLAGPNSGGTLLVHVNESISFCIDHGSYCTEAALASCDQADTRMDGAGTKVFFVIASFPPGSVPRLTGLTFGIEYDAAVSLVRQGACGDFELAQPNWPATGSGTAVTWNSAQTTLLTTAYWFAGYDYDDGVGMFTVAPHPTQGGLFADDSIPSILDSIAAYGQLGFNQPGVVPCPNLPTSGACCAADGGCSITTAAECIGSYLGNGTVCVPNPCPTNCDGSNAIRWENAPAAKPQPTGWPNAPGRRSQGANFGGTLILHSNPNLVYTDGLSAYCGQSELSNCEDAVTRIDGGDPRVIHVLAAFPVGSEPRLSGIVFGIEYGPCVLLESWSGCGNFELPTNAWPASGEGTAVTWNAPRTERVTEVYWFAAYASNGSVDAMTLIPHPIQGALFADDSVPAMLDDITALGRLGFNQDGDLPCPPDLTTAGACCFYDGHCSFLTPERCSTLGGTHQGEGIACDPNPCPPGPPPTGACCASIGTCTIKTAEDCAASGENYQGDNSLCSPNPCTSLPGACCLPDGTCQVISRGACTTAQGSWQGYGTICDPFTCPPVGACCFADGSCLERISSWCTSHSGSYYGSGTSCTPNPCPQPEPTGACCAPDGGCSIRSHAECDQAGGAYQGDGTACSPNPCQPLPGACCLPTGGCEVMREAFCISAQGEWQGYGIPCSDNSCPPIGACCFSDGHCLLLLASYCGDHDGLYQGDTVCDPNPCPQPGACCVPDGACFMFLPAFCESHGGESQGSGTTCDPNPCPPAGACCNPDGSCDLITQQWCLDHGGTPLGDNTVCDPNPCFDLPGACCLPTGACEPLERTACDAQHGIFYGYGVPCDVIGCPLPGACCLSDGRCTITYYDWCVNSGGNYYGDGTTCDPNPCPQPSACCFLDGTCMVLLANDCFAQGGEFRDDIALCEPNPCPLPCATSPIVRWENAPTPLPRAQWPADGDSRDAGPNAGGMLILHSNPALTYTSDGGGYCGQSALSACENAITRKDGSESAIIYALAAFPERSHPRLAGIVFGLNYGNCAVLEGWGPCADFELATAGWPSSGEGTALTWNTARTDLLTEVYWFAAYAYEGRIDQLALTVHPTQGAYFADDSVPSLLDEIAFLGRFGFNRDGALGCPAPLPITGACCLLDGTCVVLTQSQCASYLGQYFGDDVPCESINCEPRGACCVGQACYLYTQSECGSHGGSYQGNGSDCSPNPCGGGGPCVNPIATGPKTEIKASVGFGSGVVESGTDGTGCGSLNMNADGSYENGYAWQYGAVVPPYYGAFAECYATSGTESICSLVFDLTQVGLAGGQCMDIYVWADGGGVPGNVICNRTNLNPGTIAFWPALSRHVIDLSGCCPDGPFWVGYWGNWPGGISAWYVGADLDGFGGCPLTNIAPGIGFPTGWTNTSQVWGPTQALGIGCELAPCGAVATRKVSWGRVKALYQSGEKK